MSLAKGKSMIEVLYEDNHIIVVKKPQNILSQSDITKDADMLSLVKDYIKIKHNKPGEAYVGLVHRLDRPTGGVMVFAKTSKAAARLCAQIEEKSFEKVYYAVVDGCPVHKQGRLEHFLVKDQTTNIVSVCGAGVLGAKKAVLTYKVVSSKNNISLVRVEIQTGRSPQIRVQLSSLKTPIWGDGKYGSKKSAQNLALWATKISFVHPTTKQKMTFISLPPMQNEPWNQFNEADFKKEDLR